MDLKKNKLIKKNKQNLYFGLFISFLFIICIPGIFRDYAFHNDAVILNGFLDTFSKHKELYHLIVIGRPLEALIHQLFTFFPAKQIDHFWILRIRNFFILSIGLYYLYKSSILTGRRAIDSLFITGIISGTAYFFLPIIWIIHLSNSLAFSLSCYVIYLQVKNTKYFSENISLLNYYFLKREILILIFVVWLYPPYAVMVLSSSLYILRKEENIDKQKKIIKRNFISFFSSTTIGLSSAYFIGQVILPFITGNEINQFTLKGYQSGLGINLFSFEAFDLFIKFWSDILFFGLEGIYKYLLGIIMILIFISLDYLNIIKRLLKINSTFLYGSILIIFLSPIASDKILYIYNSFDYDWQIKATRIIIPYQIIWALTLSSILVSSYTKRKFRFLLNFLKLGMILILAAWQLMIIPGSSLAAHREWKYIAMKSNLQKSGIKNIPEITNKQRFTSLPIAGDFNRLASGFGLENHITESYIYQSKKCKKQFKSTNVKNQINIFDELIDKQKVFSLNYMISINSKLNFKEFFKELKLAWVEGLKSPFKSCDWID